MKGRSECQSNSLKMCVHMGVVLFMCMCLMCAFLERRSLAFIRFLKGVATTLLKKQLENHWPVGAVSCITISLSFKFVVNWDFPGGTVDKNPPANAGDVGSSPGPGRSYMPRSN